MVGFILTDEAIEQLNIIRDYTRKQWGKQQLKRYMSELRTMLTILALNPLMGRLRFEQDGIYSFPYASHTIYYTIQKETLIVLAILHQSMTPALHLQKEK